MSDKQYRPMDEFKNKKNIVWVIMSASMCVFILFVLFSGTSISENTGNTLGESFGVIGSVYSVMLWCGLFGGVLARYIGKNGWLGFGIGSIFGMLCFILAPVIT